NALCPNVRDYTHKLLTLIDGVDVETCLLVASSWGCLTAASFASLYSERVSGLVLVSPTLGYLNMQSADRERIVESRVAAIKDKGPDKVARQMAEKLAAPNARVAVIEKLKNLGTAITAEGMIHAVQSMRTANIFDLSTDPSLPIH